MSILSSLATKVNPYAIYIKMAVAALAVIAIFFLWHQNQSLNKQLGAAQVVVKQAQLDNQSNMATIATLTGANKAFADKAAADQTQIAVLSGQIESTNRALQNTRSDLTAAQARDRNAPNAKTLLDTDLSVLVPDLVGRMRAESSALTN